MRENKYFEAFGKPFPVSDVSWRLQYVDKTKMEGFAVPYLDARAISDRLDNVVGQFGWKDSYTAWHSFADDNKPINSQLCTIYIYDEELKEWVGKNDGAENTDVEPVKGGLSDAFKRAAVKWNIGRYLYGFEPVWVKAEQRGKNYVIAKAEQSKLDNEYISTVARITGEKLSGKPRETPTAIPPETPKNTAPTSQKTDTPVYEVKQVKVQNGASGESSALLLSLGGKDYKAFLRGKDERLKAGAKIKNLEVEKKQNSYGTYNMINNYEMAA
ncbi:MAG: Single-stranded DNA-binding protein DdrA [Firmicutes bacterium ADurb.Bin193]|nr:MAG: Single-stranded DNA-binding protein DdrA [Firmicutes bacterium ADurb.Bin193]